MKAALYRSYGPPDVVRIEDMDKPIPLDEEVLIRVRASALNPLDWRLMRGGSLLFRAVFGMGVRAPKDSRIGHDVAGEVEAVGRKVKRLRPRDAVFGTCLGAVAEYACASENKLAAMPDKLTFEQAASLPIAGLTALQSLRDKGKVQPGQRVLINGAAGGVGTFAVQVAKAFGAEVTGVCSTGKVEMVRSLGADRVIDYTEQDFTEGNERYDIILDNVGNHSLSACRRRLTRKGKYVLVGGPKDVGAILRRSLRALVLSWFVSQDLGLIVARINTTDLDVLGALIASGKATPVIDRHYRLSEAAEAIRYLEEGHARGKVIITLEADRA